ncbi:MAG TPA: YihY/virulence factor BrkB family protein [Ktedonobacteraceae bacterium]|jgi:membrane protein|nr:YihY/virulence factor BrkB family protein [Ktedonobacteraceae bacterium]
MQARVNKNGRMATASSQQVQITEKQMNPAVAFVIKSFNDLLFVNAGTLAYNLVMIMVPIALTLLALLGLLGQSGMTTTILHQASSVFPGLSSQQNTIALASKQLGQASSLLVILAIVSAILFGSLFFVVAEICLDLVYRVRPRPTVRQFLVAIGMFIISVILIPVMVFASAAPSILFSQLAKLPFLRSLPGSGFMLLSLGGVIGGLIASFILFEIIYLVVPNQRISWRHSWCGAVVAAIAAEIFLIIFPFVIKLIFSSYAGPIGFAFILLLFYYIFSVILLAGGEVNAFFFEKVRPLPNDLATFVSTMGGRLNKDMPSLEAPAHVDSKPTGQADDAHVAEARHDTQPTDRE